jgi:hypothetical protein
MRAQWVGAKIASAESSPPLPANVRRQNSSYSICSGWRIIVWTHAGDVRLRSGVDR